STANSASSTMIRAGMLSRCVSERWSYSGAALRISHCGDSLSKEAAASVAGGVDTGVSVPATVGIWTDSSAAGSSVVAVTSGTCALCVGSSCSGGGAAVARVVGVEAGASVVLDGLGLCVLRVGDAVTVLVIVVSGGSGVGVGVGSVVVI